MSEDIFVSDCSSKIENATTDVDQIVHTESARLAFKYFKKKNISEDDDATVLDIIPLELLFW